MSVEFGQRLKELRLSMGLSQSQCATHFGVTTPAWLFWEKGSREPSIAAIVEMCAFFKVSADVLLGIKPYEISIPTVKASGNTAIAVGHGATASVNISHSRPRKRKPKQ